MTLNKFHSCLSETERTTVMISCPVIIVCAVFSIVDPAALKATAAYSPENSFGSEVLIFVPFLIELGESVLQKNVSSSTSAIMRSLTIPIETFVGLSNRYLK